MTYNKAFKAATTVLMFMFLMALAAGSETAALCGLLAYMIGREIPKIFNLDGGNNGKK